MALRSAAAVQGQRSAVARPATRPSPETAPDLGLLDRGHVVARTRRRQARALSALAAACVAVPLLLAAVGHAIVASDQVRSDGLQTQIAQALQTQQDEQLQKAELVAPGRILTIAEARLHMVTPLSVTYLPPVNPGESVAQAHEPGTLATAAQPASASDSKSHSTSKGVLGSTP
jgi:hypothetical protein